MEAPGEPLGFVLGARVVFAEGQAVDLEDPTGTVPPDEVGGLMVEIALLAGRAVSFTTTNVVPS